MNTVPQPGTLLKLGPKAENLLAYGGPNDRMHAGELFMLLSVKGTRMFALCASGVVAVVPYYSFEAGWFEVLS